MYLGFLVVCLRHNRSGLLRLVAPDGSFLDPLQSLLQASLQNGDSLCAVAQPETTLQIAATERAFAVWSPGFDRLFAWGDPLFGGDTSSVQSKFRHVQRVYATKDGAFAAILADGTVVTWGIPDFGGDSRLVTNKLKHVTHIQATTYAFAATLLDGTVVTWGSLQHGGDSHEIQGQLINVLQISSTGAAFAAICADRGSVPSTCQPGRRRTNGGSPATCQNDRWRYQSRARPSSCQNRSVDVPTGSLRRHAKTTVGDTKAQLVRRPVKTSS